MGNLGEKLYEGNFEITIRRKNDKNEHLNHSKYDDHSEKIRQDFLKRFGWEDNNFPEPGVQMSMREDNLKFRYSLKQGDKVKVKLEIFLDKYPFYRMIYTYYLPETGKIACIDNNRDVFVNSDGKTIPIPGFFIETLKKYKEKSIKI